MEKNQIQVKRLQTGTKTIFTIKKGMVYDARGKNKVYCSCTGNTIQSATPMQYSTEEGVYCPNCHEQKVEIIKTYDEWKKEQEEKQRKKLENLHIVEAGSDWECGFKYYCLSTNIDYDDWLKIKTHFKYYKKGWSRGQELEWDYGEPSGWLTTNPKAVEEILVKEGLIKSENTMDAIQQRAELEKQKREVERKEKIEKREKIKKQMDIIDEKIKQAFNNSNEKRELTDVEANKHYFNPTFGKCTVTTYSITDAEIIKCNNMVDFKYGVAIPYSTNVEELIKEYYRLDVCLQEC